MKALLPRSRPLMARAMGAAPIRLMAMLLLLTAAVRVLHAQEEPVKRSTTATATAATSSTAATGYGTISGRLMSDDGRPLSNSMIFLSTLGSMVPSPPRSGITDSSGRFEFRNLPSAAYVIQPSVPGYVRLRSPEEEREETPERTYYHIGDSVNLTLARGGVITGTVTDEAGRPVVAVRVRVLRVRDAAGKAVRATPITRETLTDDRGVYRAWGLEPGSYLVSAGNNSQFFNLQVPSSEEAPTYYPSTTRDGAAEVSVRYGEEQSGIDIRQRNERGRRLSGTVMGATEASGNSYADIYISLIHAASGLVDDASYVRGGEGPSFTFSNVADGEYDLVARRGFGADSAVSAPLRVKVRGTDITGLQLVLAQLGTISGRLHLEAQTATQPAPACEEKARRQEARPGALEETIIIARLDERSRERLRSQPPRSPDSQPRSDGEFLIGGLQPGRYRLDARLPDERWYVRAITTGVEAKAKAVAARGSSAAARPAGSREENAASAAQRAARAGSAALSPDGQIQIGQGTQATGIRISVASGAAKISGRVLPASDGGALAPRLRLYLVPRETERANDPLRFAETEIRRDATFTLANLAPGRYWLLARTAPEPEPDDATPTLPLAWNAEARADLRRQAESARQEIELQPCQQATDMTLRYPHSSPRQ